MGGGSSYDRGSGQATRILIINPNSSHEMTKGMITAVEKMNLGDALRISSYTAPEPAPESINNGEDIEASDKVVFADADAGKMKLDEYDAAIVACYSVHTLVTKLPHLSPQLAVTGIFEASITTAQLLLCPHSSEKWGIVTTGKFWEDHLSAGVKSFLGLDEDGPNSSTFAGVFSTGLDAGDFHKVPQEEVDAKLRDATRRLLEAGDVKCIVMGCAGMAGLEDIIRSTARDILGPKAAEKLYVVDGVKAGVLQVEQMVRSKQYFR